jgi:hypothetical protein
MADRYWVGGSGTWNNVSTTNWSGTSGGSNGASPPVAGDDVFFNSASNGTNYTVSMAVSTTYAYRNITINGPLTGNVTFSGGSTATHNISGSVAVAASGISSLGSNLWGTTNLTATTSGQTISLNGSTFATLIFNGVGGAWTITTNGSSSSNFTLTAGTLIFDPVTWNAGNDFISSNSNVRSLNLGSATINVGDDWSFATTTNLTFSAGTSTINMTGTSTASFAGGGLTYNTVNFAPSGTGVNQDISGANTFANVSFLGPTGSSSYNSYEIVNNLVITGTLTATGATAIRRIFLCSNTVSTTITLTAAAVSLAHVDFQSITVAGAAAPATGTGLGDCGGNSGITFPAAKTVYWNLAGTQNWSATGWATTPSGSPDINNFPLAQDTAVFTDSGATGTVAIQAFNIGTVDASGRTTAMTLNYSSSATFYGSHTWSSILSIVGTSSQTFGGRGTMTFTTVNKTFGFSVTVNCVTGTFQLADALTTTGSVVHTSGTFNTASNTLTCNGFSSSNSQTRTITLGTSTINLSATGNVWSFSTTTGLTFSGASSTINLTDTSATARTFQGSGLTYGTLNIGGATGISTTTISVSSGTIGTLSSTKTVAHTISFGANTTITNWTITGTSGNVVTVNSDTIGTQRTITYGGGQINLDYMSFRDINMSYTIGAANPYLVYAGANSTNVGNNLGIAFIDGATKKAYRLITGTSWTVPADWNSSNNNIYLIGAGGGGGTPAVSGNNRAAGGGGGGGGYTAITNFSASPSSSISYTVGTSAGNANGGATTWNSGAFTAGGGSKGNATTTPDSSGGAGGTGTFAGGTGGAGAFGTVASTGYGAGGGGGAGGPNGVGGNGGTGFGSLTQANISGGGGGGNGGGSAGANATSAQGGNGGNNFAGTGGGAGSASGSGTAGTVGGGGGGAANTGAGGAGGSGIDIENTLGGGGGGGGNATGSGSVTSGLYGGGGAGGRVTTAGSFNAGSGGGTGVIFIVYTLGAAPAQNSNFFLMF